MHAWIVAAVLCQPPVELTIVVAEPWEECERSEFVVDAFCADCDELSAVAPKVPTVRNYHSRLVELRAECEPWQIVTWSDVGDSDMECPAWTLDRLGRRKPKWVKFREDVLIGYHPDVLMHLRYVRALRVWEHLQITRDEGLHENLPWWFSRPVVHGREKWFRRIHTRCKTMDGRDVSYHYDEPVLTPWPPVNLRLGWSRVIHGRVEMDGALDITLPPNTEVVRYEPDWSVVLPELDMGAGVLTQLHGSD